jgi:FlaA1/EpsC-like NDP-sugar epimerase
MLSVLSLLNRKEVMFEKDTNNFSSSLLDVVSGSTFLVLGAAGTIGQAVTKEIFKRNPLKLHVIDISENNLVELVRDIRSSLGYIEGDFQTFALDIGSIEYDAFIKADGKYDYVLNLSALKHVRSEKDPYTLMRMIDVNIFNTNKTIRQAIEKGSKKYFCVSTDKAANPVNMMGASKRIMELFLMRYSLDIEISTARFANVAFSDGSLLHSFSKRIDKRQPIVAPNDIVRYFITPQESGFLCLMSCVYGENRDVYFPKLSPDTNLISFASIAERYIKNIGYEPHICNSESEARVLSNSLPQKGKWPCFFSKSDTTGEKEYEEFFTDSEVLNLDRFNDIGIIKNEAEFRSEKLDFFESKVASLKVKGCWGKEEIVDVFEQVLPNFDHFEVGKYLDSKM